MNYSNVIGEGEVHVPTHFFKIISKFDNGGRTGRDECYVMEHMEYDEMTEDQVRARFRKTVRFVTAKVGFNYHEIFDRLSATYKG